MNKKWTIGMVCLLLALVPGVLFSAKGQASYVTSDTNCTAPIDLEDNSIVAGDDPINVYLKLPTGVDADDLCWSLEDKGKEVLDGTFDEICTTSDGKYTLAETEINPTQLDPGSYSLDVSYCATGDSFGNDSFRILAAVE